MSRLINFLIEESLFDCNLSSYGSQFSFEFVIQVDYFILALCFSYLVCTITHLMALRLTDKNDYAHITVNRPLAAIAKITCKKKHPEFVTFQYGSVTNITDMDRCLFFMII